MSGHPSDIPLMGSYVESQAIQFEVINASINHNESLTFFTISFFQSLFTILCMEWNELLSPENEVSSLDDTIIGSEKPHFEEIMEEFSE